MKSEAVTFNGITFRRYPASTHRSQRVYFWPPNAMRKRGVGPYHVELFKSLHGAIPEDHHIHHKDENPLNNDPSNFECLPIAEHARRHWETQESRWVSCIACGIAFQTRSRDPRTAVCSQICKSRHKEEQRPHEDRACILCGATFSTVARRRATTCSRRCAALLRERDMAPKRCTCIVCGKGWESRSKRGDIRYCSPKCRDAHYAQTGRFLEDRICAVCSAPYRIARSSPIKTCSRPCGYAMRNARYKNA